MFTFIKKVIKTGTALRLIRWSRLRLIKTSVVSQTEPAAVHRLCGLRQCLPVKRLTVETDLATGELAWQFNLGRASSVDAAKKSARRRRLSCRRIRTGGVEERRLPATVPLRACNCRVCNRPFAVQKEIDYAMRCLSTTATAARKTTAKALRLPGM